MDRRKSKNRIRRVYYGWAVVAVSFFTLFLAMGVRYSFSVYYIAILGEYGWGRAETAGAFSLAMIFHALFAPVTGNLIDRFGPRKLFPIAAAFLFFGLLAASRIREIWHLYLFFGVFIAIGINALSYSPHMSIIPRWFIRKRGLASGLALAGVGIGTLVLVPFSEALIATIGWRAAFFVLSCLVLFLLVPANAIIHRRSPEEVGQFPDGLRPDHEEPLKSLRRGDSSGPDVFESWTFSDAVRVKAFWFIVLMAAFDAFTANTMLVHQAVYVVDAGFSPLLAASMVGLVGLISSVGGILCGILSDRVGSKVGYTMGGLLAFMGVLSLLQIHNADSPWMLYAFVLLYGLGTGAKQPMFATITGGLFPGNALGRIMAMQSVGFGIGGAAGAYGAGYFFDRTGDYSIPFSMVLASIALGVLMAWLTQPSRRIVRAEG